MHENVHCLYVIPFHCIFSEVWGVGVWKIEKQNIVLVDCPLDSRVLDSEERSIDTILPPFGSYLLAFFPRPRPCLTPTSSYRISHNSSASVYIALLSTCLYLHPIAGDIGLVALLLTPNNASSQFFKWMWENHIYIFPIQKHKKDFVS